jgi:hypothetical protein
MASEQTRFESSPATREVQLVRTSILQRIVHRSLATRERVHRDRTVVAVIGFNATVVRVFENASHVETVEHVDLGEIRARTRDTDTNGSARVVVVA